MYGQRGEGGARLLEYRGVHSAKEGRRSARVQRGGNGGIRGEVRQCTRGVRPDGSGGRDGICQDTVRIQTGRTGARTCSRQRSQARKRRRAELILVFVLWPFGVCQRSDRACGQMTLSCGLWCGAKGRYQGGGAHRSLRFRLGRPRRSCRRPPRPWDADPWLQREGEC